MTSLHFYSEYAWNVLGMARNGLGMEFFLVLGMSQNSLGLLPFRSECVGEGKVLLKLQLNSHRYAFFIRFFDADLCFVIYLLYLQLRRPVTR
jgi:hypothetical protein